MFCAPEERVSTGSLEILRSALATGQLTPRVMAEQALAHSNSNAVANVYLAADRQFALRQADDLPRRFSSVAKPLLFGLPVSLKDCFDLAGFVTTCGSRFYASRNAPAGEDSSVAARLRELGAVIVGKTHMHPLAYGITGENPDYGDCTQPADATRLTGGSSSGAAASVQEGSAVAAIGTDTGGSIRVPAALCGLAGYRASIELAHARGLWRGGVHLSQTFDTLGWLFRDLRDGVVLGAALFRLEIANAEEKHVSRGRRKLRIGCVAEEFLRDCEEVVRNGFAWWRERLRTHGETEIVEFDSAFWEDAMEIYAPIQASEAAAIHSSATAGDFSVFEKSIAERLAWGASISAGELADFRRRHVKFRERMDALLGEFDFLIAPCAPVSRLTVGQDHANARKAILRYTTPGSLAGMPIVTLPAADGAGVQLIAARGADAKLLRFAAGMGGEIAD
jgi:Asp-tRNA(Asn)/Glu-tRNA(Gln) amidotransferase A subunit family amidase